MSEPRFTITIAHRYWSCGDGCCSDSGYEMRVDDNNQLRNGCLISDSDWLANPYSDRLQKRAVEAIAEILGRSANLGTDYEIVEKEDYEDYDDSEIA